MHCLASSSIFSSFSVETFAFYLCSFKFFSFFFFFFCIVLSHSTLLVSPWRIRKEGGSVRPKNNQSFVYRQNVVRFLINSIDRIWIFRNSFSICLVENRRKQYTYEYNNNIEKNRWIRDWKQTERQWDKSTLRCDGINKPFMIHWVIKSNEVGSEAHRESYENLHFTSYSFLSIHSAQQPNLHQFYGPIQPAFTVRIDQLISIFWSTRHSLRIDAICCCNSEWQSRYSELLSSIWLMLADGLESTRHHFDQAQSIDVELLFNNALASWTICASRKCLLNYGFCFRCSRAHWMSGWFLREFSKSRTMNEHVDEQIRPKLFFFFAI